MLKVQRRAEAALNSLSEVLRHNCAEKVQDQPCLTEKKQRWEERNEHELPASNERLLYDDVHRGFLATYRDLQPRGAGDPAPTESSSLSLPPKSPSSPDGSFNSGSSGADLQGLAVRCAIHAEGLVLARSTQSSTGFEGVYASGGGYGAELEKGKRLRQDGFRSPVEAALERARWTKSLTRDRGRKGLVPSAGASFGQQEQLAAEALAGLVTGAHQQLISVEDAAHAMHEERRWLSRPLHHLTGSNSRLCFIGAGFDAELQTEATQPSSPFQATLEGRGMTTDYNWRTFSTPEEKLFTHVMCNYSPRAPGELPMKCWVSCEQLRLQLQSHAAAAEEWQLDYIKQMVTNRFKDHPAFAGHSFSAWCRTLKNHDAPAGPGRRSIMKFSFEYTQHAEKH